MATVTHDGRTTAYRHPGDGEATVDTGRIDFHLRASYDTTYDEYLAGMTYEEMTGQPEPRDDGDRRYQF